MPAVTLRDIAERANVSVNTVSRALNDKPEISPRTKERIVAIANELGYTPNLVARGLVTQRTKTLGIVTSDNSNPFYAAVIRGVFRTAQRSGWTTLLANSHDSAEVERRAVKDLIKRRVDGLMLFPLDLEALGEYAKGSCPVMAIGCRASHPGVSFVSTDDRGGARSAVRHLIRSGRRRIVYAGPSLKLPPSSDRYAGYVEALEEAGLEPAPHWEIAVTGEAGYRLAERLRKSPGVDAVFCFSDVIAIGLLRGLADAGLKVPADVAVVGYDDLEFSRYVIPSLTTVRIPMERLGEVAARTLIARIEGADAPPADPIPTELVVRESAP